MDNPENKIKNRKRIAYYLRVLNPTDETLVGYLVDFTDNGLTIISGQQLDVYRRYALKIMLPEKIKQFDSVAFEARCISKREENRSGYYMVGFEFSEISEENLELIALLMSQFGIME